jgi:predicted HTH domain antitoxin
LTDFLKQLYLSKWEFQKELGIRKIERHYEEKDLEEDIKFAYSHK